MSFAGFARIIKGRPFAIPFRGQEKEALLGTPREPYETGFAIGIGTDLEVEFVQVQKSVGDADTDIGGIDRLIGGVCNVEIGSARAEPGIDHGDSFRVDRRGRDCWQAWGKNYKSGDGSEQG